MIIESAYVLQENSTINLIYYGRSFSLSCFLLNQFDEPLKNDTATFLHYYNAVCSSK